SVVGGGGKLDATSLAAAADLDLRLDHHRTADLFGDGLGALGGLGHPARGAGHVVLGEKFLGLIFEKVHGLTVFARLAGRPTGARCRVQQLARRTVSTPEIGSAFAST